MPYVCSHEKKSFVFDSIIVVLQVFSGNIPTIDGCATFFRRDRFSQVKKYEVGSLLVQGCVSAPV